jgi:hypothetical protein
MEISVLKSNSTKWYKTIWRPRHNPAEIWTNAFVCQATSNPIRTMQEKIWKSKYTCNQTFYIRLLDYWGECFGLATSALPPHYNWKNTLRLTKNLWSLCWFAVTPFGSTIFHNCPHLTHFMKSKETDLAGTLHVNRKKFPSLVKANKWKWENGLVNIQGYGTISKMVMTSTRHTN